VGAQAKKNLPMTIHILLPKTELMPIRKKRVCVVSACFEIGSDLLDMKVVKCIKELLPPQDGSEKLMCLLENPSIGYDLKNSFLIGEDVRF